VVPVIANGFRALGLIAAAQWIGSPQAALADHILYGWIFFSLVLVMLVMIGHTFSDLPAAEIPHAGTPSTAAFRLPRKIAPVAALMLVAAASGPMAAFFLDSGQSLLLPDISPTVAAPWRKLVMAPEWKPVLVEPSRSFSETFVNGAYQFDRFIALYGRQGPGNNLVRSSNRDASERAWSFDSAHRGTLFVRGTTIPVRVTIWFNGTQKRIVWSFYVVNGRPMTSVWDAKRSQLTAYLTGSRCVPAYIAVSGIIGDETTGARMVANLLSASKPLRPYLCEARGAR
jgi:EpsI family protein